MDIQEVRQVYETIGSKLTKLTENKYFSKHDLNEIIDKFKDAKLFYIDWTFDTFSKKVNEAFIKVSETKEINLYLPFNNIILIFDDLIQKDMKKLLLLSKVNENEDRVVCIEMAIFDNKEFHIGYVTVNRREFYLSPIAYDKLSKDEINNEYQNTAQKLLDVLACLDYINNIPEDHSKVSQTQELTPKEVKYRDKGIKPFFGKKEVITIMHHNEVKKLRQSLGHGHHASPIAHERRGHFRNLQADRWKKKGQKWFSPAKVNFENMTWTNNKKIYKVVA